MKYLAQERFLLILYSGFHMNGHFRSEYIRTDAENGAGVGLAGIRTYHGDHGGHGDKLGYKTC